MSRGEFRIELGQRSTESKPQLTEVKRVNLILPPPRPHPPGKGRVRGRSLVSADVKGILLHTPLEEEPGLYFITALLFDCIFSVPAFLYLFKFTDY